MAHLKLRCECGEVQGKASDITPENGNHVVCCCCDCQAFAHHLGKGNSVLDEFGGSDIYQTSQSQITITQGSDKVTCLRLSAKGITRWYTTCCNTPVGNTLNAKMPFVGIINTFIAPDQNTEEIIGPVRAYVQTQHATSPPTYPKHHAKFPLGITLRILSKIIGWKLRKMGQPSDFYNERGKIRVNPVIVSEQKG